MIEVQYIRTSMLLLNWDGLRILTDPWFAMQMRGLPVFVKPCVRAEQLSPLDVVLVSHLHPDHFDRRALRKLSHPIKLLVGPPGMKDQCDRIVCQELATLADGQSIEYEDLAIKAFSVAHSGYENAYLLRRGEMSLFFAGDARYTEVFAEIGGKHQPLVSLLPVGGTEILGRRIVMNPDDAVQAAHDLQTKVMIPIHPGGEWMSVPPLSRHPGRAEAAAAQAESTQAPFSVFPLAPGERVIVEANGKGRRPE